MEETEELPPPPPASLKPSSHQQQPQPQPQHHPPTANSNRSSDNHAAAAIPDAIYYERFLPVEQNTVRSFMGGGASASSGKYVGQLLRGTVRHGRGSCAMSDGSYYEGDW